MDLILWRHAEAEPGEPDLGRRLTAKGHKQAERMGEWLDRNLPEGTRVLVSPADRAQQTAAGLKRKFRTVPEIAPGATVMLKPGGYHIMFMGLKAPIAKDSEIPVTLVFEKAGSIDIALKAAAIGAAAPMH